jgi:hypothetical protein
VDVFIILRLSVGQIFPDELRVFRPTFLADGLVEERRHEGVSVELTLVV